MADSTKMGGCCTNILMHITSPIGMIFMLTQRTHLQVT